MALRLRGSTSGYAEIDAPAVAGDVTLTLPSTTGTINVKDASGNTEVGTGVTFGNPSANIFTINNTGGERLRIAADGTVSIPGALNVSGVLTYEDVTSVDAIGLSTFRDGLNTKDVGITTISTSVSDTAVDVFIYDTSKDSDGGEWRKRTSHTSWYNETLNTSTRGSRREFPSVAVIVAESVKVTIYDGDDPDLPMWMVLNADSSDPTKYAIVRSAGKIISSLYALNGIICDPVSFNGLFYQNFVEDACYRVNTTNTIFGGSIVNRNGGMNFGLNVTSSGLVSSTVNDVAMTVLPNAHIDSATGLPIPTIAVATNGGVSIIKDDGTVVDIADVATGWIINKVDFYGERLILNHYLDGSNNEDYFIVTNIPSSDTNYLGDGGVNYNHGSIPKIVYNRTHNFTDIKALNQDYFAVAAEDDIDHLILIDHNDSDNTKSMVNFITSDYNTGWMHGDIKGAFLSDTDTTNVTGTELVTNGTFSNTNASSVSSWTNVSVGTGTISEGSGYATLNRVDGGNTGRIGQGMSLISGKQYTLSFDLVAGSTSGVQLRQFKSSDNSLSGTFINYVIGSGTGTKTFNFVCEDGFDGWMVLPIDSSNTFARIDNFSVKQVEEDRSVNNNPLQVFGTITKSAVATGADLVAYSGFSASNYLQQPYNGFLNVGTGDYCFMGWIYSTNFTGNQMILGSDDGGGNIRKVIGYLNSSGQLVNHINGFGSGITLASSSAFSNNVWSMFVFGRKGGVQYTYINGILNASGSANTENINFSTNSTPFAIGYCPRENMTAFNGSLSLIRTSTTFPSAEQIKKIYEDEKVLFQENAKATLYGSSDAVTALGYDEVTDQLHVGTSSGRSDFQGLRRINNTTTAVTTAISAHDSFILEQ